MIRSQSLKANSVTDNPPSKIQFEKYTSKRRAINKFSLRLVTILLKTKPCIWTFWRFNVLSPFISYTIYFIFFFFARCSQIRLLVEHYLTAESTETAMKASDIVLNGVLGDRTIFFPDKTTARQCRINALLTHKTAVYADAVQNQLFFSDTHRACVFALPLQCNLTPPSCVL